MDGKIKELMFNKINKSSVVKKRKNSLWKAVKHRWSKYEPNIGLNKVMPPADVDCRRLLMREAIKVPDLPENDGHPFYGAAWKEVSTFYYLEWFEAYGGMSSLVTFLRNRYADEIRGTYEAFLELDLPSAAQYVADAVVLLLVQADSVEPSCAVFTKEKDLSWFRSLQSSGRFTELAALDHAFQQQYGAPAESPQESLLAQRRDAFYMKGFWVDSIRQAIDVWLETGISDSSLENTLAAYDGYPAKFELIEQRRAALPESARHLYYLWWFNAYSGVFSVSEFMLSRNEDEIRGAYEGFLALGQLKAAQYMADAIGLVLAYCDGNPDEVEWAYDFYDLTEDLSWFRSLARSEHFPEPATLAAAVAEHHRTKDDETEFDEEGHATNLSLFSTWQAEIDTALREYCEAIDEESGDSRFDTWLQQHVEQHFDELVE